LCVNGLSRAVSDSAVGKTRTRDLSIISQTTRLYPATQKHTKTVDDLSQIAVNLSTLNLAKLKHAKKSSVVTKCEKKLIS